MKLLLNYVNFIYLVFVKLLFNGDLDLIYMWGEFYVVDSDRKKVE